MKIGPYHLISELGSGGMAQVWLAHRVWEDGTRRSVVFKFTRRKGAADEATLRQLVEEGRLSILLSHNNIVSTIDVGIHERVPYLVMEYIPGRDLAQLMLATARTGGGWDVETAVYVVREVAQALKYAHELERDGVHQQIISSRCVQQECDDRWQWRGSVDGLRGCDVTPHADVKNPCQGHAPLHGPGALSRPG